MINKKWYLLLIHYGLWFLFGLWLQYLGIHYSDLEFWITLVIVFGLELSFHFNNKE